MSQLTEKRVAGQVLLVVEVVGAEDGVRVLLQMVVLGLLQGNCNERVLGTLPMVS